MISSTMPVSVDDVIAAARTIAPVAVRTRFVTSPALDAATDARVFLKPEVLQRTGSFKFRGAYNKLSSIPQSARGAGVVAFSSGNHAQGVAAAAQLLGMKATIVMPSDAPQAKIAKTRGYGAQVVLYDRMNEDREAIAKKIRDEQGATLVPPYDDAKVIAGQGTIGLEMAEDFAALGIAPDIVAAPASGGGLMAGISLAVKASFADARMMIAEPAGFDDHAQSLRTGKHEKHSGQTTICDALMASTPGVLTFAINSRLVSEGVVASDEEVGSAIKFAFNELKLVVEPGGAVALAALLSGYMNARGKTIAIVLSGGNIDADLFARLIR